MPSPAAQDLTPLYRQRFVAAGYDALNAALWLPTGSDRLRRRFVSSLDIGANDRVLELGCGTGLVTRHLCATGADVSAIERAPAMLTAAQRRAPTAHFTAGDVLAPESVDSLEPLEPFDCIVLAFVLHELAPQQRNDVLRAARRRLGSAGRIGILEWGRPTGSVSGWIWRSLVHTIEPAIAHDILDSGLDDAIAAAGLSIVGQHGAAGGRARVILAH